MPRSSLIFTSVLALPLTALHAQTVVSTKATCLNSYLSDPDCWLNSVSPISTEQRLFSVNDIQGKFNVIIDVPNTLNSFASKYYNLVINQDFTVLNNFSVRTIHIQPAPGAQNPVFATLGGGPNFGSIARSITLMPGSNLTLSPANILSLGSIHFGQGPDDVNLGPASLTFDSTTLSLETLRLTTHNLQPATVSFPSTTVLAIEETMVIGAGPITIEAPLLEEISSGLSITDNDSGFQFNAPNLRRMGGINFDLQYGNPTGLNIPPLDIASPVRVVAAFDRTQPLIISQLARVPQLRISENYKSFPMSFPNLIAANTLSLGECAGTIEFPDLLLFDSITIFPTRNRDDTAPPLSLLMPLADHALLPVAPEPESYPIILRGGVAGTYDRVDLRSLSSLPADSEITIPQGATVRFDSLAEINDVEMQINATFDAPFPPITSLDRSVFQLAGDTNVTIQDNQIEIDDHEPFLAGPNTVLNFEGTESARLLVWNNLQLIALSGTIEMPALTTIEPDSGALPTLEVKIFGPNAHVSLPVLTNLLSLRINYNLSDYWMVDVTNEGTPLVTLELADIPSISTTDSFQGRLIMPAQSALTNEHTLRGNAFVMPGVSSVISPLIDLAANPDSPFLLDLSGATELLATSITTTGQGTIDIPSITPELSITVSGGPVLFPGDITSRNISGNATIKVAGNLLPAANNASFPLAIEMIGEGIHTLSPLRADAGPNTTRKRRGLTVGTPNSKTKLHLVPRPNSDFDGAIYLGPVNQNPIGLDLYRGSVLYLNDVPAYLWQFDPAENRDRYMPLADLIPPGSRCASFGDGRLCLRDCPADINNDNILDLGDINAFVAAFLAGNSNADFNNDGILDLGDITTYIQAFLADC